MLRGSTGIGATEAGSGVADLMITSGRELMRLQQHMTGKNSHFELNALCRFVVDAPHPFQRDTELTLRLLIDF